MGWVGIWIWGDFVCIGWRGWVEVVLCITNRKEKLILSLCFCVTVGIVLWVFAWGFGLMDTFC